MSAPMPNPFDSNPAPTVTDARSAAATSCPQPAAAAEPFSVSVVQPAGAITTGTAVTDYRTVTADNLSSGAGGVLDILPSGTEAATSVRTAAASDCPDHNLKFVYECIDGTMFHCCDTCGGKAYLNEIPEIFRGHYALNAIEKAASDIDQLANYFRRHDSRFVPDKEAMWDAMFDETAPRAVLDPIWADEPPLFLQAIG